MLGDFLIKVMADWLVIVVIALGAYAMLRVVPKKHRYYIIARGVITGLIALLLAKGISLLYQGERPFVELGVLPKATYLNNPGFPSDHTLFVFTITLVVWASTKNKALGLTLLVLSVLVGSGRLLALVHTPADVVGGIACALVAALLIYGWRLEGRRVQSAKRH